MDAGVVALQNDYTTLSLQVQSVVDLIAQLRASIAAGGVDPVDEAALVQLDTQLQALSTALGGAITPPAVVPAAAKPAA